MDITSNSQEYTLWYHDDEGKEHSHKVYLEKDPRTPGVLMRDRARRQAASELGIRRSRIASCMATPVPVYQGNTGEPVAPVV